MAFKKTADLGYPDPNVNRLGRIQKEDKPTNRSLREKYLVELLRKLRPLQANSITQVQRILNKDNASDQNKLKAAAFIVGLYKDIVKDTYRYEIEDTEEDTVEEIQVENPPAKLFSLTMIRNDESVDKE